MFFDENRVWPRPEPPRPATPRRGERFLSRMLLIYALILLLLPVSAGSMADLIVYLIALF